MRHPRLYKYENLQTLKPGIITVHTTGRSEGGTMPDAVIEKIQENYKTYTINQVKDYLSTLNIPIRPN